MARINHIAQVLEIAAPVEATAEERRQWVAWWKPSYESALKMTDEHKATLKNGHWWPPLCASMIDGAAPDKREGPVSRSLGVGGFTPTLL